MFTHDFLQYLDALKLRCLCIFSIVVGVVVTQSSCRDVCMTIVRSSEWETAMKNVRMDLKGRRITPFRMLIRKFPDVAEAVLNR